MANNGNNKSDKQIGGVTANRLAVPILIAIILLNLLVVFLFYSISKESRELSTTMQKTGEYTSDATSLLAGSSKLSETCTTYLLMPVRENGDVNYDSLFAYVDELKSERRGPLVEKRFEKYDVSDEDRAYISSAAAAANRMMDTQLHALALMNAVHRFSDVSALSAIPLPELTEEEKAYSDERKESTARQLVLGTEYARNKQTVSSDVNVCCGNLKKESSAKLGVITGKISRLKSTLWIVTAVLILVLLLTFLLVYQQILFPLKKITDQIRADQPLTQVRGLREVREMSIAYNGLLRRRDTLEGILRAAAVTDALTNLPNRYAFQQYLVESSDAGYSLGVVLFDVNYLKQTNDSLGHAAGDELLRQAAECIASCFGSTDDSNCFRLGGDEFAAILKNPTMDLIHQEIDKFEEDQQRRQISISWGFATTSELADTSLDELVDTADQRMYEQKRLMHQENGNQESEDSSATV